MCLIVVFWFLFLIDSLLVMFSFIFFVSVWISLLYSISVLFIVIDNKNSSLNDIKFFCWDYVSSRYVDFYWFTLGGLFVTGLLIRLCLLLYFGSSSFLAFDLCKCVGFQWYWIYHMFGESATFSNLLLESDYFIGDLRLLQTNHVVILLSLVIYKFWLSAVDVIHSFTIAALGIKVDCIPGRCNEVTIFSSNSGCFYGQCSELCGVLHGFMPICIQII